MNDFTIGKIFAILVVCNSTLSIVFFSKFKIYRLLNPFVTGHFVLISIFGLRPLFMRYPNDFRFYGLDSVTGFNKATATGVIASLMLSLGFFISKNNLKLKVTSLNGSALQILRRSRSISWAIMLLWVSFMVFFGGFSVLSLLLKGRSDELNARFKGVPILLQALPAASFIIFSSSLIILLRVQKLKVSYYFELIILFFLTASPSAFLGDRRIIVPMAICLMLVFFYRHKDLSLGFVSLFFFFIATTVLTIYPYVRSSGARQGVNLATATFRFLKDNGIVEVFRGYLVKNDTEMFNFVSFLIPRLGVDFQYGYGRGTFIDLFRESLPSFLELSHTWSDKLLTSMFGEGCAAGLCPVPSLVGVLLYDYGIIGVGIGFLLVGILVRRFEANIDYATNFKLIFAITMGCYGPVIVRGSSIAMIWIALNVSLVGFVAHKYIFHNNFIRTVEVENP